MEQENPSPETSFQQDCNSQQASQNVFQQNPPSLETTEMRIENVDSEDLCNMNLSQLLKACQFKKAFSLLQNELESKRASLGEFNIELVPLLNQMAEVQITLAQYPKTSELCQKSEQILQKYQEDPDYNSLMAHTYQIMAIVSRENKEYKRALDLINKSLTLSSADSVQSIDIHRIKALILCNLMQYKEALQEIQRSLQIMNQSMNTIDSLFRARVYNTLGEIQFTLNDWKNAKIAYEMALEICKSHNLNFHVEMAKACEGLGKTLIESKRLSPVISGLGESALEIYNKCFGEDNTHPARISSFLLLARYFQQQKEHSKAKEYINLAVEDAEAFYGVDCEKIIDLRLAAAKVTEDIYLRDSLVNRVLEIATEGKSGRELANLYLQYCEACLLCKDYDLFKDIFPEAVNAIKNIYGEKSLEMAKVYEEIAKFYRKKKQREKSLEYHERSIEIYREIFGKNHIEIGRAYLRISATYSAQKKYYQAILYTKKALKIQVEFYGEASSVAIETSLLLANGYEMNKEFLKSVKAYFKVLKIQEEIGDEMIYETYEYIGTLYLKMNDAKNSGSWFRKSYQLARVNFGMNDAKTLDTKEWSEYNAEDKDLLCYDIQEMIE